LLAAVGVLLHDAHSQSTWTTQATSSTPGFSTKTLRGIASDESLVAAVGDEGKIVISTDCTNWSLAASNTVKSLRSITRSPSLWVASGESGTIVTSADAITWTTQTGIPASFANKFVSGVTNGGGTYVAVGGSGQIMHSADAVTWTSAATVPQQVFLQSVGYGAGKFVAVGVGGTIMYSSDGSVWHTASSGTSSYLSGIAFGNGIFVTVGLGGTVLTSPDGITWTSQISNNPAWLRSVTFGDGRFVAGGDDGTMVASTNGVEWDPQTTGTVESIFGLTYNMGHFIGAGGKLDVLDPGKTSRVMTSPTGLDLGFRWGATSLQVNETGTVANIDILKIGPTDTASTAQWAVTGGAAMSPADFTGTSGTAVFGIGEDEVSISIPILDDSLLEGAENIILTLTSVTPNRTIHGSPDATITILDDEDLDSDTLPDAWEIVHFGSIAVSGPTDDPDFDNNDNTREYDDGTDPDNAGSAMYFLTSYVASGSGSITKSPSKVMYAAGESIDITAVPASGWQFLAWQESSYEGTASITLPTLTIDSTIGANFLVTIGAALDQPGIEWFNGSAGYLWEGQTTITHDGFDAIEIDGDQMSSGDSAVFEAIVFGPGELSFQWKVSSAQDEDYLRFYVDSAEVTPAISGEVGWVQVTTTLTPGFHHILWSYDVVSFSPDGHNSAWVDEVSFTLPYAEWAADYFTPAEVANPLIGAEDADPDEDGKSNFYEYATGDDPLTNFVSSHPQLQHITTQAGHDRAALIYQRPVTRLSSVTYMVETSEDLTPASWVELPVAHEPLSGFQENLPVQVVDPSPFNPRRFYRLTVSPTE